MFLHDIKKEKCYLLPEDGDLAKQDLIGLFHLPNLKEVYIKAYAFNMDILLKTIKDVDSQGIKVSILADYVQSRGRGSWNELVDLRKNLKTGEILLTTAGCGSKSTSQIWHSKAASFIYSDKEPINFEGSCNFSDTGFLQGNTIRIFSSQEYSDTFIKHFNIHRDWTLSNAQSKQIDYLLEHPVSIESISIDEDNAEIFQDLENMKDYISIYQNVICFLVLLIIIQWIVICLPICH